MNNRKSYRWNALSLVLGITLILFLLVQIPLGGSLKYLKNFDFAYLLIALALGVVITIIRSARFYYFFVIPGRVFDLYTAFAVIRAANYVLPLRMGEPVSLVILKRWQLATSITETAPAWILFRISDVISLLMLMAIVSSFVTFPEGVWPKSWTAIIFLFVAFSALLSWLFWRPIKNLWRILGAHLESGRFGNHFEKISEGMSRINSLRAVILSFSASLLIWLLNILLVVCGLFAFQIPVDLVTGALISSVALSMSLMPIRPPLGIGVHESVWVGLLIVAGFDKEQALAGAIAARTAQIFVITAETAISFSILSVLNYFDTRR